MRKFLTHHLTLPDMPYCGSLWSRRLLLTLSNASEKSMISTSSWHPFSTAADTTSTNPSNWDSQDLPQQKPCCSRRWFWCSSTYPMMVLTTICSRSLKGMAYAVVGDGLVDFWLVSFPCDETSLKYIQILIIQFIAMNIKHDF